MSENKEKDEYREVFRKEEMDGVVGTITKRDSAKGPRFTFRIDKEYVPKGERERKTTHYFNPRHIPVLRRMLDLLEDKLKELDP